MNIKIHLTNGNVSVHNGVQATMDHIEASLMKKTVTFMGPNGKSVLYKTKFIMIVEEV